jgi:hypothetical protein
VAETAIAEVDASSANLVIYRPDDGSTLNYRIWVDGHYMGKLKTTESLHLRVKPGEHVISCNDRKRTKLRVTVAQQGTSYVRHEIYRKTTMSLAVDKTAYQPVAGL